jgi:hypothetical protein
MPGDAVAAVCCCTSWLLVVVLGGLYTQFSYLRRCLSAEIEY